jgi:hypothetical protein
MFASGARPKRTLVFVFVTGHLRLPAVTGHGQAATAWLTAHPEWWSGKNGPHGRSLASSSSTLALSREREEAPKTPGGACRGTYLRDKLGDARDSENVLGGATKG